MDAVVLLAADTKRGLSKGTVWHEDSTDFACLLRLIQNALAPQPEGKELVH